MAGRPKSTAQAGSRRPPGKAYYMISAVAQKYNIHPQTLRLYEREGLLKPSRTEGNTRLYSEEDLEQLETILCQVVEVFDPLGVAGGVGREREEARRRAPAVMVAMVVVATAAVRRSGRRPRAEGDDPEDGDECPAHAWSLRCRSGAP